MLDDDQIRRLAAATAINLDMLDTDRVHDLLSEPDRDHLANALRILRAIADSSATDKTPYCIEPGCSKKAIGKRPLAVTEDGIPIVELVCEEHESRT